MTLITYSSRVHFADGVLEEALRSEMEAQGLRRPFLLTSQDVAATEFTDRLVSAIPFRVPVATYAIPPEVTKYEVAKTVVDMFGDHSADVLIAYGSVQAIAYGRKCRHSIGVARAGHELDVDALPPFYVVPGIDGFPDPCRVSVVPGAPPSRGVPPSVVIYDPSLTLDATPAQAASAGVNAMSQCIEAFLSPVFNPPADGIAMDGVLRAAAYLHRTAAEDSLEVRREMMAVGLNAALAQQKGVGPTQAIVEALETTATSRVDTGAVKRLLLPGVVSLLPAKLRARQDRLRQLLRLPSHEVLSEGIATLFRDLPLPNSLSDLGFDADDLADAAQAAHESVDIVLPDEAVIHALLEEIHCQPETVPRAATIH